MSGVKNVRKIIRRVKLDVLCCTTNLDAPYPSSLTSHSSLSFPLLVSPSHLASSFPVTNIASFRTIERVQKDVPTTAASNSLLKQVMIAYLEGQDLSQDLSRLALKIRLLCCPSGK